MMQVVFVAVFVLFFAEVSGTVKTDFHFLLQPWNEIAHVSPGFAKYYLATYNDPLFKVAFNSAIKKMYKALRGNKFRSNIDVYFKYMAKYFNTNMIISKNSNPMDTVRPVILRGIKAGFKRAKIYKQVKKATKFILPEIQLKLILDNIHGHPKGLFDKVRKAITYGFRPIKGKKLDQKIAKDEKELDKGLDLLEKLFQRPLLPKFVTDALMSGFDEKE